MNIIDMKLRKDTAKRIRYIRNVLRRSIVKPDIDITQWIFWPMITFYIVMALWLLMGSCHADNRITTMYRPNCYPIIHYTCKELADAIYIAEGGSKTKHPYGILARYRHTDARTACLNTIRHNIRSWLCTDQREPFLAYLGRHYAPVGCSNDNGSNKYWIKNVKYWLEKG